MLLRKAYRSLTVFAFFLAGTLLHAQDGEYSGFTPYSVYGVGQVLTPGTAYNKSMGGTGIATRNIKYINYLNPAAVTARDTLSFMVDMSLSQNNSVFRQGDIKSANNLTNINDLAISFPIYKSSAMMLGVAPYSATGYGFGSVYDDQALIGRSGSAGYTSTGQGSLYQLFIGGGATFWKRISIGAEWIHYFGTIAKNSKVVFGNSAYYGISSGYGLMLRGDTGKFGLQYEQSFAGGYKLTVGATYKLRTDLKGIVTDYSISSGAAQSDTLRFRTDTLALSKNRPSFGSEMAVGISFGAANRWRAEVDYTRSNWSNSNFDVTPGLAVSGGSTFSATCSESLRAGFEYIPNANDIRYYMRKCTYRAGAYWDRSCFLLDGNNIDAYGITLGITFPVFRYHNGVTLTADLGRRGSIADNMIRETFVNFTVGFNLFDYWFIKHQYE